MEQEQLPVSESDAAAPVLDGSDLPMDDDFAVDETAAVAPTFDPTTPEFEQFSAQFKQVMGLDLKEAIERVQNIEALHAEALALRSENAAIEAKRSLQSAWSVSDAEFDRRLDVINKYAAKYPEQVAKYDSLDGLQVLWETLSKRKGAPGVAAKTAPSEPKRYKAADIRKLMSTDVDAYKAREAEFSKAYQEGRVDF